MNSISMNQKGHKKVKFHDGQTIQCNHPQDTFFNVMMGTLYQHIYGKIEFFDYQNGLHGYYEIGKVKKKS
jgi:hypothetical protein